MPQGRGTYGTRRGRPPKKKPKKKKSPVGKKTKIKKRKY
tara:strand:- start:358 stop:474 length:117 start_codon:yes stop_codon:yes gene_type:complete